MKKLKYLHIILILSIIFLSACANDVDRAISKLGGSEEKAKESMDFLLIVGYDIVPSLIKNLSSPKINKKAKLNILRILEKEGSRTKDVRIIRACENVLDGHSEKELKVKTVEILKKMDTQGAIDVLKRYLLDKTVGKYVWDTLEEKAEEKVSKADRIITTSGSGFKKKVQYLKEALGFNPLNYKIVNKLASLYSVQGNEKKAKEIYNMHGIYVRKFSVLGPLKSDNLNVNEVWDTSDGWFVVENVPMNGNVDFRRNRETRTRNKAFLISFKVTSPQNMKVLLKIMSRDKLTVLQNKKEIYANDRGGEYEQIIKCALAKGDNKFMLQIKSRRYAKFSVKLSDYSHKPLKNIKYKI